MFIYNFNTIIMLLNCHVFVIISYNNCSKLKIINNYQIDSNQ